MDAKARRERSEPVAQDQARGKRLQAKSGRSSTPLVSAPCRRRNNGRRRSSHDRCNPREIGPWTARTAASALQLVKWTTVPWKARCEPRDCREHASLHADAQRRHEPRSHAPSRHAPSRHAPPRRSVERPAAMPRERRQSRPGSGWTCGLISQTSNIGKRPSNFPDRWVSWVRFRSRRSSRQLVSQTGRHVVSRRGGAPVQSRFSTTSSTRSAAKRAWLVRIGRPSAATSTLSTTSSGRPGLRRSLAA